MATQTVRHRDYFTSSGDVIDVEEHADPTSARGALVSLALLVVALAAVHLALFGAFLFLAVSP